jgi:hypothetical protein
MNAHIRDNLNYLKGNAGAVAIADNLGIVDATPTSDWAPTTQYLTVATAASPGSAGVAMKGARAGSDNAFAVLYGVNLSATGSDKTGGAISFNRDGAADSANMTFYTRNAGTVAERLRITKEGFLNAKAATGGGMLFLSATAVAGTLQTLAAAGTVTQFALIYTIDRNNTGGAVVTRVGGDALVLGGSYTYTNTDNVTVTLTAGGAITVQRVSGTTNHEVELLVLYK